MAEMEAARPPPAEARLQMAESWRRIEETEKTTAERNDERETIQRERGSTRKRDDTERGSTRKREGRPGRRERERGGQRKIKRERRKRAILILARFFVLFKRPYEVSMFLNIQLN